MLEANTFRFMMLIGSVVVMAALVTGMFYVPFVSLDDQGKTNYENVMSVELEADELTAYQALVFNVKAKLRGGVNHY